MRPGSHPGPPLTRVPASTCRGAGSRRERGVGDRFGLAPHPVEQIFEDGLETSLQLLGSLVEAFLVLDLPDPRVVIEKIEYGLSLGRRDGAPALEARVETHS